MAERSVYDDVPINDAREGSEFHAFDEDQPDNIEVSTVIDVRPEVFHFTSFSHPCTYWSNRDHIVSRGECRCGLKFVLQIIQPQE